MTLSFLRELRALRGEISFFINCKEANLKRLLVYLRLRL
jgi:hypothetical protein